ncbi:MAG TPA: RNA polymerase sigma factor RpoD/SigA [Candidatus Polarisedimenticolia bacterium]|nr:RNA polymerase sigma factor RpoD/SigA [Candidatus Polarisedimenticolia bacterium]
MAGHSTLDSSWAPWYLRAVRDAEEPSAASDREAQASWDLVRSHLFFVVRVAKQYRHRGLPLEDLVSEGNLGLIEAARRFDPDRGVRFISWSVWWIRKAMRSALDRHSSLVRVPDHLLRDLRVVEGAARKLSERLARRADRGEIARETGLPPSAVERLQVIGGSDASLEESAGFREGRTLADRLSADSRTDPEQLFLRGQERALVSGALFRLAEKERRVVALRFGLDGEEALTLKETGHRLGLSHERVRQIESCAKARLLRILLRQRAGGDSRPASRRAGARRPAAGSRAAGAGRAASRERAPGRSGRSGDRMVRN